MKFVVTCLLLLGIACGCSALIIPEELPSLLSIIYSNIPPIKNGFDSRFGIGFRLGQHADVQLMTEIGPQSETQPLGESSERRRYATAPPSHLQQVAAEESTKRRRNDVVKKSPPPPQPRPLENSENSPPAESWLAKWHRTALHRTAVQIDEEVVDPEVTAPVDGPVMSHLSKLYKPQE